MRKLTIDYCTITEVFGFGPAVTKLVLNLAPDNLPSFSVQVRKADLKGEVTKTKRKVVKVSASDEVGNDGGNFTAIELEVHPDLFEASCFAYDPVSELNVKVLHEHDIRLLDEVVVSGEIYTPTEVTFNFLGNKNLLADDFIHNQIYQMDDKTLRYAYYEPVEKNVPLIIWLHGAGEGGEDTYLPTLLTRVTHFIEPEVQKLFGGAYVLVPQTNTIWMDIDGTKTYNIDTEGSQGESYYTEVLMGLITDFVSEHAIDPSRVYLGGASNGGYMTINLLANYPDYFAAAFPAATPYSAEWLTDEVLKNLKEQSIWLTHTLDDPVVRIAEVVVDKKFMVEVVKKDGEPVLLDDHANALFSRLVNLGADVHYSLYDKVIDYKYKTKTGKPYRYHGHFSWIYTLNNECRKVIDGNEITLFEWLAKQKKA